MEYPFTISGGIEVRHSLDPIEDSQGRVVGFTLPNGRKVDLVVALGVHEPESDEYTYLTLEGDTEALSFRNFDYDRLEFGPDLTTIAEAQIAHPLKEIFGEFEASARSPTSSRASTASSSASSGASITEP